MRFVVVVAVIAGCTPPAPPPSYYTNNPHRSGTQPLPTQQQVGMLGQATYATPVDPYATTPAATPVPAGHPSAVQLACGSTIVCYTKCKPISEQCMERCDAATTQAGASAGARLVVSCMLDSGCKDEACVRKACTAEFQGCLGIALPPQVASTPPPARPVLAPGELDLSFQTPGGWTQAQLIPGAVTLQRVAPGIEYRIHVFPSQSRTGSIGDLFSSTWTSMVGPSFDTPGAHGPYRRRLASGYPLAYDAAQVTIKGSAKTVTVGLYLLFTKDRVVTMMSTGLDADAEPAVARFLDALSIKGVPSTGEPLFEAGEVTGTWVAGADRLSLEAGGRFTTSRKTSGTWKLDDDTLILDGRGAKRESRKLCGRGPAPSGGGTALCIGRDARPAFTRPSATWYAPQ